MNPLRIAIAGLGTVGSGVIQLLMDNADAIAQKAGRPIEIAAVAARSRGKVRSFNTDNVEWVSDVLSLSERPDIDAVVELIGGSEGIARALCEKSLLKGKAVITANKAMIAAHGLELARLAEKNKATLQFEAAVGGGIPIIKTMREALAGNMISSVRGILNGTCNYILTRMVQAQLDFPTALAEAQKLGYAEADPAADVDGHDSAHKLAILASLAFGMKPSLGAVSVQGLREIKSIDHLFARELGCRIKLLGVARRTEEGVEQRVAPCLVPMDSTLATTNDVLNAIQIEGDAVGPLALVGRGAGAQATASAVVGDLIDLARGNALSAWGIPATQLKAVKATDAKARLSRWYLRLQVTDKAGVMADIAAVMRDETISMESVLQRGRDEESSVPLIIVTHKTDEASLRKALTRLARLKTVWEQPFALRMEG